MIFLERVGPPLLGAAGIAVAASHWHRPHAGVDTSLAILRETVLAPEALPAFAVASALLWLGWRWGSDLVARSVGIPREPSRRALLPAVVGPGVAAPAALLDAVAFRCTAPALLGLGAGLGLVAAWAGIVRRARDGAVALRPSAAQRLDGEARPGEPASPGVRAPERDGRRIPALLLVGLLATGLPLALLPTWSEPAGDEPHYLLVAHSMLTDADLDVGDEYADGAYRPFHPGDLSPHSKPGRRPGSRYSMHGLGLPLVLLPAYAAGVALETGRVALPRLLLVVLYGLFAVALYRLLEDLAGQRVALAGTLATTLSAPLVFSPLYLFPEVPAMWLACLAFRRLRRPVGPGPAAWGAAAAVFMLPWLGVKYLTLAGALVVGSWLCGRGGRAGVEAGDARGSEERARGGVGTAWLMTAALGLTLAVHGAWTWSLYGSVSPFSVYLGSAGSGTTAPALGGDLTAYLWAWRGALSTAVGYLADQKEGLLLYGPHFLLAAAGLPWLWRHRRRDLAFLGLLAGAYVGPYALSQQLGGQGPAVRPLMAVLWVLAVPLGVALTAPAGGVLGAVRGGLLALAASVTAVLAVDPALLPHDYPVEASRLVRAFSPQGAGWWRAFPQWVNVEAPNPWATAVTTGLLLATAAWLLWLGRRTVVDVDAAEGGSPTAAALAAALLLSGCAGGVLVHRASVVVTDLHRATALSSGLVAWVEERLPERMWAEVEGVWVRPGRAMDLVLTAPRDLERMVVRLGSVVETTASVWIQGDRLSGTARPGFALVGTLEPDAGWPWRGRRAWRVRLRADRGAAPAALGPSRDERVLGAFLQIDAVVPATSGSAP